jgi:hypothetical protein
LAAWLTVNDRKVYLKDKAESIKAAGAESNSPELTDAVTESKTVDIDELRALIRLCKTGYKTTTRMAL